MSRTGIIPLVLVVMLLAILACTAPNDDQMARATDAAEAQETLDALRVTVQPTPTIAPTSVSGYPKITVENVAELQAVHEVSGSAVPIQTVAWSRDSSVLAAAAGTEVNLIDTQAWEEVRKITSETSVIEMAVSPNGYLMLTVPGADGREGVIWDTQTGQPTRTEIVLTGVTHAAWSPDGTQLALSRAGGLVELISMDSGRREVSYIPRDAAPDIPADLPSPVTGLWISPDGTQVAASIDQPAYLIVWGLESEDSLDAFDFRQQMAGVAVEARISPTWDQFVWLTENTIVLAEMESGANREALTFEDVVRGFAWSPDGTMMAIATAATINGTLTPVIKLIDAATAQEIAILTHEWSEIPAFISFSPDGSMIAIPNGDGSFAIWAVEE